jgi:hypothetical protein
MVETHGLPHLPLGSVEVADTLQAEGQQLSGRRELRFRLDQGRHQGAGLQVPSGLDQLPAMTQPLLGAGLRQLGEEA